MIYLWGMEKEQLTNDKCDELEIGKYYLIFDSNYGVKKTIHKGQFTLYKMTREKLFWIKKYYKMFGKNETTYVMIKTQSEYDSAVKICERFDEWK